MTFTQRSNACEGYKLPQIIAILSSSSGLSYAWTSPSIPALLSDKDANVSIEEASYFTVISSTATLLSSPLVSIILNTFGRKIAVLLVAVPQLLGWFTLLMPKNIWAVYVNRVLDGIGLAAYLTIVPIYVCEVSEPKVRVVWGNAVTISFLSGMLLINIVGSYNSIQNTSMICCCFPVLYVILLLFMPESPYYLLMKNRYEHARHVLQVLQWSNVEKKLIDIKEDVERQMLEKGTIRMLFSIKSYRKAFLICAASRTAQNFGGLSTFETYTQYIFQQMGCDISEKISSIVFSGTLLLSTVVSTYLATLLGRRILMLFSCFGSAIILSILATYFYVDEFSIFNVSGISWLPLVGMLMYLLTFSPGIGMLTTIMFGELFPTSIKGIAAGAYNVLVVSCIIVPKLFQILTTDFGMYAPFVLFSSSCFIFGIFFYFFLIETKGKTLEEIQEELKGNKSLRSDKNVS